MTDYKELFSRNIGTLTVEQQRKLFASGVAVVGCGGLGGYVIEELIRIGVGCLHCFDPDVFSVSNGNRQLNATQNSLGRNKSEVAAERAAAIHNHSTVHPFPGDFRDYLDSDAFAVQLVVDCLDSIEARHDLSAFCRKKGLELVHGAVKGWYGQVGVQPADGDLLDRLYPPHTQRAVHPPPSVLVNTVALVASLQVGEVVKLLLGLPSPLIDSWLYIDLKDLEFTVM